MPNASQMYCLKHQVSKQGKKECRVSNKQSCSVAALSDVLKSLVQVHKWSGMVQSNSP